MRYYLHSRSNVLGYSDDGFTINSSPNCCRPELTKLKYKLSEIIKSVGGKNLRWARYKGLANLPRVITFDSDNIDEMEKKFSEIIISDEKADYYFFLFEKYWK